MPYLNFRLALPVFMAFALAACGGSTSEAPGGGSPGNGDGDGDTDTPTASSIVLFSGSPQLPSNADDPEEGVQITALVRDSSNVALAGQPVSFSVSNDGTLVNQDDTTNDGGIAQATLITPGNPTNRTLTVGARSGNVQQTVTIDVFGTTLSIEGPDNLVLGDSGQYTAQLLDAAGDGIPGRNVTLTSDLANPISSSTTTTNNSGQIAFQVQANNSGTDVLTAEVLQNTTTKVINVSADDFEITSPAPEVEIPVNTNQTINLSWLRSGSPIPDGSEIIFSATRGQFTGSGGSSQTTMTSGGEASVDIESNTAGPATIEAIGQATGDSPTTSLRVEFVATTPSLIVAQATPQTLGPREESTIRAVVRDADDNPVKNQTVNFNVSGTSGGALSDPTAITDSRGIARTTFTAGDITSGQRQIEITTTTGASLSDSVTVTVARSAIDVEIGTGNEIEEPDNETFAQPFKVLVTDTAGNPIVGEEVQLNVFPVQFRKGLFVQVDTDGDMMPDQWAPQVTAVCGAEDIDRDGFLEPGEDFNNNSQLDPGNIATVPTSVTTDDNGLADFTITYTQENNLWASVRVEATVDVSGTEDIEARTVLLPALSADLMNLDVDPPGQPSPFGVSSDCADPG